MAKQTTQIARDPPAALKIAKATEDDTGYIEAVSPQKPQGDGAGALTMKNDGPPEPRRLRIPFRVAALLRLKRDGLSSKIRDAIKANDRPDWGPEIEVTDEEIDALEAKANALRADPETSAKVVSAANKLMASIKGMRAPTARRGTFPVMPTSAGMMRMPQGGQNSEELDRVMSQFDAPAEPEAASKLPEYQVSLRRRRALKAGTIDDNEHRRSALARLAAALEIMEVEHPGVASLLRKVIDDVKQI